MLAKQILEKNSSLKLNKDFFVGYSPERINPGDKRHQVQNIKKILAIETRSKKFIKDFLHFTQKLQKNCNLKKYR